MNSYATEFYEISFILRTEWTGEDIIDILYSSVMF